MVKRFDKAEEPKAEKLPLNELPKISRDSRFSPFGDQKAQRRESLGKSLFTRKEPKPQDITDAQYADAVEWLGKAKIGQANMYELLRAFGKVNLERPEANSIVEFHDLIKEALSGDDADATMLALLANIAYLLKK